jgi:hypothetical protein
MAFMASLPLSRLIGMSISVLPTLSLALGLRTLAHRDALQPV